MKVKPDFRFCTGAPFKHLDIYEIAARREENETALARRRRLSPHAACDDYLAKTHPHVHPGAVPGTTVVHPIDWPKVIGG